MDEAGDKEEGDKMKGDRKTLGSLYAHVKVVVFVWGGDFR